MISVATFDLSKNRTGWAVGSPAIADRGGIPGWGVHEPVFGADKEHLTMKAFWERLEILHERYSLTHIVYEEPITVPTQYNNELHKWQYQYVGVLLAFAGLRNIDISSVAISTWRTRAYGMCKAPPHHRVNGKLEDDYWKKMALGWTARRGWNVTYHDEAEALCMLDWALSVLDSRYAGIADPLFRRNELDSMYGRGIHQDA